jgi:hypothetical protein
MLGVGCLAVSACTTIEVEGAQRVVQRRFGVLAVVPDGDAQAVVLRTRGFGLVPSANGVTVGYRRETAAYFYEPTQCRVVLFPENQAEVDSFFGALDLQGTGAANICNISEKDAP